MEMISWPILWLIAGHFIGDFAFQSEWMTLNKGKSWEINAYHAFVYAFAIFVVLAIGSFMLSPWALLIIFSTHFLIDPLQARWKIIRRIWIDQVLHLAAPVLIALFLL